MILSVLIFNTHGVPRLSKFYTATPPLEQRQLIAQIYKLVSDRPQGLCSFLDAPELRAGFFGTNGAGGSGQVKGKGREIGGGRGGGFGSVDEDEDVRVIYRYVTYRTHPAFLEAKASSYGLGRDRVCLVSRLWVDREMDGQETSPARRARDGRELTSPPLPGPCLALPIGLCFIHDRRIS